MTSTKQGWTAGAWKLEGNHIVGQRYICELSNWHIDGPSSYEEINAGLRAEREANARLIAAIPAMYEALEALTTWMFQSNESKSIIAASHATTKQGWENTLRASAENVLKLARGDA